MSGSKHFRIISYNVLNGFTDHGYKQPFETYEPDIDRRIAAAKWIAGRNPDVVAFQELNFYTEERLLEETAAWGHKYAVLLKESGYPTGLTSKTPITDVARVVIPGLHHGFIRARTADIVFYVVHLSPHEHKVRQGEAGLLINGVPASENSAAVPGIAEALSRGERLVVCGDFNSLNPAHREHYHKNNLLGHLVRYGSQPKPGNINDRGDWDYTVIEAFLKTGLVDSVHKRHPDLNTAFSYISPILDPEIDPGTLRNLRRRLDYAMLSPDLDAQCLEAKVANGEKLDFLSDHYPIIVDLNM